MAFETLVPLTHIGLATAERYHIGNPHSTTHKVLGMVLHASMSLSTCGTKTQ